MPPKKRSKTDDETNKNVLDQNVTRMSVVAGLALAEKLGGRRLPVAKGHCDDTYTPEDLKVIEEKSRQSREILKIQARAAMMRHYELNQ